MNDTKCQCEAEGGSSLVRSTKSDTSGMCVFLVITMSRTWGVTEGFYDFVVWESGLKIRQEISSA